MDSMKKSIQSETVRFLTSKTNEPMQYLKVSLCSFEIKNVPFKINKNNYRFWQNSFYVVWYKLFLTLWLLSLTPHLHICSYPKWLLVVIEAVVQTMLRKLISMHEPVAMATFCIREHQHIHIFMKEESADDVEVEESLDIFWWKTLDKNTLSVKIDGRRVDNMGRFDCHVTVVMTFFFSFSAKTFYNFDNVWIHNSSSNQSWPLPLCSLKAQLFRPVELNVSYWKR